MFQQSTCTSVSLHNRTHHSGVSVLPGIRCFKSFYNGHGCQSFKGAWLTLLAWWLPINPGVSDGYLDCCYWIFAQVLSLVSAFFSSVSIVSYHT